MLSKSWVCKMAESLVLLVYVKSLAWAMGVTIACMVIHAACNSALKKENKRWR